MDGWLVDEPYKDVVVELKLRMRTIPPTVPLRDILQVQTYLAMHGVQRAAHVQRVIGTSHVVINMIERDAELWDGTVMPDVQRFVCDVRRLLRGNDEDEAIRHRVLFAAEKTALPLAQLPAAMASELRANGAGAPTAAIDVTTTAAAAVVVEDQTHPRLDITLLTVDHHSTAVVVFNAAVVVPEAAVPGGKKRRRKHVDDDVLRLPTMRRVDPVLQAPGASASTSLKKKRVVITALRNVLSLSSRVKRASAALPVRPYNTRSRSRSR